jgi:hypothetical protein
VAFLSQDLDRPDCPDPDLPCAGRALRTASLLGEVSGDGPVVPDQEGTLPFGDWVAYRDEATGFALQYDPALWTVEDSSDGYLLLILGEGAAALVVDAVPAGDFDPEAIL